MFFKPYGTFGISRIHTNIPKTSTCTGKRNKQRIIPLTHNLKELIKKYLVLKEEFNSSSKWFFVTNKGDKLYEKFVYRKVIHYLSIVSSNKKRVHIF